MNSHAHEPRIHWVGASEQEPVYASKTAAGADLRAATEEPLRIAPGERMMVSTGLRVAIPPGFEAQVRPRSGLAARFGVTVLNAPGTIDSDYRGEIKVILVNLGNECFTVQNGERIAQLVIAPVCRAEFIMVDSLDETQRGSGGFGSTGLG